METSEKANTSFDWAQIVLQEYLLVVQLPLPISTEVRTAKETVNRMFHQQIAEKSGPHIVLASFYASEAMEDTIFRYVHRILKSQKSFEVVLNNYGSLPSRSLNIRVQNQAPFKQIITALKAVENYIVSCHCPPVHFFFYPHISIAEHMPVDLYFDTMMEFSQKTFHETFMVDTLVLLRRSRVYNVEKRIQVFTLQPETSFIENSLLTTEK